MIGIIFGVFFLCLVLGIPIAMAMGFGTIFPALLDPNFQGDLQFVVRSMIKGVDTTSILAIPLFMLSGAIMATGGLSKKLFDVFAVFIGKLRGGMPCAVIVTCLFYGAISGSGPATCAAVGAMCIPFLTDLGYEKTFSAALVATAGGLGVIIPPSIPFIAYGLVTNTSVGDLFTAGILPGCLIALTLMIYTVFYCARKGEDRQRIESHYNELRSKGILHVIKDGFWALLTPVIILGGIYSGIVTPTEAACISVFYAIIVCLFIYKSVRFRDLLTFFQEGVKTYAPLGMMLALAQAFMKILVLVDAPQSLANFLSATISSKVVFLLLLNLILFLMGMVLDVGPAIMILAPMLLPFATKLGVDPIHLGIIMTVNLAAGFVTPPFGMNLFVAAPMVQADAMTIGKRALPLIGTYCIALLLITFIPAISLVLVG
ncbi:TRAP transporter large permease [Cuneatibacter sp. NSJ-177]|uniref:TRAP transporter large permease n=1 Tax=Cuneatibacter sp. NSJ-177 TaxID=2931401 RepID=UPI001FD2DED1|nr:TRAP transporter large permease [Cuneatibacter sp. NSJ-177]MCJ7835168.1 TRAP transporter large permease [Cuneatibacter sp. NSJ-177]